MRAESLHPSLGRLGPDLLDPDFDADEALRRLRDPSRAGMSIGEALLDQRALAGIGNIWKNETLWTERVSPFATVGALDDETARAPGRDRAQAPARQCRRHARRPGRGLAQRLRSHRPAVPALPDADRQRAAGDRDPADDLLVPDLPADTGRGTPADDLLVRELPAAPVATPAPAR